MRTGRNVPEFRGLRRLALERSAAYTSTFSERLPAWGNIAGVAAATGDSSPEAELAAKVGTAVCD